MVSVMCCQHVNKLDAALADSVKHTASVPNQAHSFPFNTTEHGIKAEGSYYIGSVKYLTIWMKISILKTY